MKRVIAIVGLILVMAWASCAMPQTYPVEFTSKSLGKFEVNLPEDVPDFTGDKWFRGKITDKYCGLIFLQPNGFYKMVINCNKPKVYALIEEIDGKVRCWLYYEGIPVPVSVDKIQALLLGEGT
ncbi:hypothetical protein KAR91_39195 [Candidatus Pacearchaeota archaeon]|nr:hypothetical protein [Candidatus Pacearchaeota archaeon]